MLDHWKTTVRRIKRDTYALALASRDPRTPWAARLLAIIVVAYACSPIDLIPDFIPMLGMLDDLLLLPIGIWLAIRLIPDHVLEESRLHAENAFATGHVGGRIAAGIMILLWASLLVFIGFTLLAPKS